MNNAAGFLPGFYRQFEPAWDESLAGYLLRLASDNGYLGIGPLLKVISGHAGLRLTSVSALRANETALGALSRMLGGGVSWPASFLARSIPGDAVLLGGTRVDQEALMHVYAQVCPACLRESAYAREDWDLSPVTHCLTHGSRLLDQCEECGERVTWKRPSLYCCGKCHADFRTSTGVADICDAEVAADFAALAPFRFETQSGARLDEPWDSGFVLLRLLATPPIYWARNVAPPNRFFSALSVAQRIDAAHLLAKARGARGYRLALIGRALEAKVAHLDAIQTGRAPATHAYAYCLGIDRLHRSLADEVFPLAALRSSQGHGQCGADYGRQPPVLQDPEAVREFLAIDPAAHYRLQRMGRWPSKSPDSLGYDVDEVREAGRFLREELLAIECLPELIGVVPSPNENLFAVLRQIKPDWHDAEFVTAELLSGIQNLLRAVTLNARAPRTLVKLQSAASAVPNPATFVAQTAARVLSGGISSVAWEPPFRWADLQIEASELDGLLGEPRDAA